MFVASFNAEGGFPFETKIKNYSVEAFDSEDEATDFATRVSKRAIYDRKDSHRIEE
jgi:hypothetical protein